jgi:hypothetical protein
MTGGRSTEDGFFEGTGQDRRPAQPHRRESPLLARSPVLALLTSVLAGWLLWSLAADVAYFFSSREPIDLGGPGAYRLDLARENRLVHVRGRLEEPQFRSVDTKGGGRGIGRLMGTNLLVDHPGTGGPPVYEGRLLPAGRRSDYDGVAFTLAGRGTPLAGRWQVLRDGERPRRAWLPVVGTGLLLVILGINVRALLRMLFLAPRERP